MCSSLTASYDCRDARYCIVTESNTAILDLLESSDAPRRDGPGLYVDSKLLSMNLFYPLTLFTLYYFSKLSLHLF